MKEQQQASKRIWPYPGAGSFVVLMGNVERKGWCWSGTDCKGRSGSAEQRGGSFIIVRGCGAEGRGVLDRSCSLADWQLTVPYADHVPWRGNALPAEDCWPVSKEEEGRPACTLWLPHFHVVYRTICKSRLNGIRGIQWGSKVILAL